MFAVQVFLQHRKGACYLSNYTFWCFSGDIKTVQGALHEINLRQNKEVQFLRAAAPLSGQNRAVLTWSWPAGLQYPKPYSSDVYGSSTVVQWFCCWVGLFAEASRRQTETQFCKDAHRDSQSSRLQSSVFLSLQKCCMFKQVLTRCVSTGTVLSAVHQLLTLCLELFVFAALSLFKIKCEDISPSFSVLI